jgi:hypothetical protein
MAMPEDMPRIKDLVARLDVNVVDKERMYHIYSLENVAAEDLSKTLDDFIRDAGRVQPARGVPCRAAAAARGSGAVADRRLVLGEERHRRRPRQDDELALTRRTARATRSCTT